MHFVGNRFERDAICRRPTRHLRQRSALLVEGPIAGPIGLVPEKVDHTSVVAMLGQALGLYFTIGKKLRLVDVPVVRIVWSGASEVV